MHNKSRFIATYRAQGLTTPITEEWVTALDLPMVDAEAAIRYIVDGRCRERYGRPLDPLSLRVTHEQLTPKE